MSQRPNGFLDAPGTMPEPRGVYTTKRQAEPQEPAWSPLDAIWGFLVNLFTGRGMLAAAIWLAGVYCTRQVTGDLLVSSQAAWLAAFIAQGGLSYAESPIWRRVAYDDDGKPYKRDRGALSWIALATDAVINLVGTWAIVGKLHALKPVQSIGEIFETTIEPARGFPAFLLCLVLAGALCGIPEKLWHQD